MSTSVSEFSIFSLQLRAYEVMTHSASYFSIGSFLKKIEAWEHVYRFNGCNVGCGVLISFSSFIFFYNI